MTYCKWTLTIEIAAASIVAAFLCASSIQAQSQTFEVASVKPNNSASGHGDFTNSTGRFTATNVTLKAMIRKAYGVQMYQISGGPAWLDSDHFDIVAKAEAQATPQEINKMLQSLLTDQFRLKLHRDTKELPVYALVVGKNGPKLSEATEERSGISVGKGQVKATGVTMELLATTLSTILERPVVDKTRIAGRFDLKLSWTPDSGAGSDPVLESSGPSIFTAIQEQIGLRLESTQGPVAVLVIDSAEKPPHYD